MGLGMNLDSASDPTSSDVYVQLADRARLDIIGGAPVAVPDTTLRHSRIPMPGGSERLPSGRNAANWAKSAAIIDPRAGSNPGSSPAARPANADEAPPSDS